MESKDEKISVPSIHSAYGRQDKTIPSNPMALLEDDDELLLNKIGYAQVVSFPPRFRG